MTDLSYKPKPKPQKWEPEEIFVGALAVIGWIWITVLILGAL